MTDEKMVVADPGPHETGQRQPKDDKQREKELEKEYKSLKKKNRPLLRAFKFAAVALLVGVVIGASAVLWIQSNSPEPSDEPSNVSVVFERVMEQNELVTASQKYQLVEKVEDAKTFFDLFEIPITKHSYWYRHVGTIKVAVDLSKAQLVSQEGNVIAISLEKPYISSNTPDMEESCVLEENNNILNPIEIEEVDEYKRICMEKVEAEAKEGSLLEEAQVNAEATLSQLFSVALDGEYEVEIQWKDAEQ